MAFSSQEGKGTIIILILWKRKLTQWLTEN